MTRLAIAVAAGAALLLGADALAQPTGPGFGTPIVPTGNDAVSRVATRGANFLEIGLGARAQGMAGAYAAVAEGFSAMYYNLAGTAEIENVAGGLTYAQLYGNQGLDYIWGGALLPLFGGGVGLQVGQLSSGDIQRTTSDFPGGGDPNFSTEFRWTSTQAMLSYGRRLTDRLNFGVGLKYATEGISDVKASWVGLDLGLRFRTGLFGTTIGAALSNIGSTGKFQGTGIRRNTFDELRPGVVRVDLNTERWEMPTMFRFSVMSEVFGGPEALVSRARGLGNLRAVAEFNQGIDTDLQFVLGGEYAVRNILFLRAGKRWMNEQDSGFQPGDRGLAFGTGIRVPLAGRRLGFDYAWNGAGELPNTNHFSFEFGF